MIKLYNTLSRKKETFKPLKKKTVSLYTCGPTVYWHAHLGNLRTYVFEDILRRVLKYNGHKIKQAMNITDVEDKIIKKAQQEKKDIYAVTKPYEKFFLNDLKKLNIEKAEFYPKATGHIKKMIALIKKLMVKKIAYQGDDGSIYFNISKFKNYGRLSELNKREIKIGARISADEYKKENAQDFVLWKTTRKNENFRKIKAEWPSPWGNGRPGWHIECSAMSMKYLGQTIDIHAGAVDLIFPHHENEIAQSEAASGKKFVRFWIHGEHLLIDNQKMSKSLGNIYALKDLEAKKFNPLALRYLILTSHYRSKLNFTWKSLAAAQNALNNLTREIEELSHVCVSCGNSRRHSKLGVAEGDFECRECKSPLAAGASGRLVPTEMRAWRKYKKQFLTAINDDLNTPKAIALVWQIIKDNNLVPSVKKQLIFEFDKVLGLKLNKIKHLRIPPKIKRLAAQRGKLRVNKQFIQADVLRKKIEALGYIIEDTTAGPIVLRKS